MTPIRRTARAFRPAAAASAAVPAGVLLTVGSAAEASAAPVPRGARAGVVKADGEQVKYYVVGKQPNGQPEFLFAIAEKVLGDGNRFTEIFALNKGRVQPDGGVMTDPASISQGWILQLPADASGDGVQFGPLPTTEPAAPPAATASTTPQQQTEQQTQQQAPQTATATPAWVTPVALGGGGAVLLVGAVAAGVALRRRSAVRAADAAAAAGPLTAPVSADPPAVTVAAPSRAPRSVARRTDSPAPAATAPASPVPAVSVGTVSVGAVSVMAEGLGRGRPGREPRRGGRPPLGHGRPILRIRLLRPGVRRSYWEKQRARHGRLSCAAPPLRRTRSGK
ncbi:hypothetical protein OG607_05010 [Streptomyces sp. NBC_01537]|uniref:hypothetical protein n=1 Tax=Streptomyces sp. NBC_01537 TaxID=2903896 RepID=UPI003867D51D